MGEKESCALLGQLLVLGEIITPEELRDAVRRQQSSGERLGEILMSMGAVAPRQLERALRVQARLRGKPEPGRPFILVVDDDTEVGAVVADVLSGGGYRVGVAQDEAEAMASMTAQDPSTPALLVLDLRLPEYGGVELLARLREADDTRDLPVVILTGVPELEATIHERGLTISAFLSKPVSARELLEVVERIICGESQVCTAATP